MRRIAFCSCLLLASAALPAPMLQLPCDGNLRDASGHGHDAYAARARFAPGHTGQGLLLGAGATVPDDAELRLAPGLRLEAWVRFDGRNTAGQTLVNKEREYMLRTDPAGEGGYFAFFVWVGGWEPRVRSTVVPRTGEWYHLVAGWDGRELSLEVNGAVSRNARAGEAGDGGDGAPLQLGPLDGVLDDLSLTNPAAGQAGTAFWPFDADLRDASGHGHELTGGAGLGAGRLGQSARLDSVATTPDTADLRLAPGLRIDCDVYFDKVPASYGYLVVKDGEYMLRVDSPGEGSHFSFFVNLGGWEPRVQSPVKAEPGIWYHLSARWDGLSLSLDVNGQHKDTMRSGLARPGGQPLVLGPVAGRIDNLRIENPRRPVLRLRALVQEHTLLQAGQPEKLTGLVENLGAPAQAVTANLELGPGVTCQSARTLDLGDLDTGASRPVEWTLAAEASVSSWCGVQLATGGYKPAPYRRALGFFGAHLQPTPPKFAVGRPGTTWYIDSQSGDNTRAGTSPETAWRDFERINDKTLGPGDRLLLRRGSVFDGELRLFSRAAADNWAEIGAYGDPNAARPILRRNWDIDERCVWVRDADFLRIRSLTVCYAGKGLVCQYTTGTHGGLIIEDCLAHHIEGLYRTNAHGIPEWQDREGAPGDGLHLSPGIAVCGALPRDVLVRDCETFACSWGWFIGGDNVTVDRVFCHHNRVHNTSPHPAMVSVRRSWLTNCLFDAPGWHASAGTMGIMLVDPQGLVIRNCTFRNQPDSGSADEGGIDFENSGNGCLIDGCTFERNAGAAIEVLGLQVPQPRNVEIAHSRFIENNLANKLGPGEIYVWGSPSADVCCSVGTIHDNAYVTKPGVAFFVNEAPKTTQWTLANNQAYASPDDLRRATTANDPPAADAGPDVWTANETAALRGRVTDDRRPTGGTPRLRWEVVEGPGPVRFSPADQAATTAALSQPGDYLLRLVADDGELWHSDLVSVHRSPAGTKTVAAFEFNQPGDTEGWTAAGLGTKVRTYNDQPWPTRAEPVNYAAGGFYIVALDNSTDGHLLSKDGLDVDVSQVDTLRLRLMNHTPATALRLRFTTQTEPTWDDSRSVSFAVTPNDTAPRVYTVDLSRQRGWSGRLRQLRLDLATGAALTGTLRIDYLWLGSAVATSARP